MIKSLFHLDWNRDRVYGLDILRAVAILFVIHEHGITLYPADWQVPAQFLKFDGVFLFFVLSGFLIGGILIRQLENGQDGWGDLFHFWTRRWFRTLPNYYLILIVVSISFLIIHPHFDIRKIPVFFYFGQNLFSHDYFFFGESWSLSVEEWFYLLIPIVMLIALRYFRWSVKHTVFAVSIAVILLITAFRWYRFSQVEVPSMDYWDLLFRKQVSTRLDSIMYGVLTAAVAHYASASWQKKKEVLLLIGIGILVSNRYIYFVGLHEPGMYFCVFYFTLNAIGVACLLPYLTSVKSGKGRVYRVMTKISLISYSLYLTNFTLVKMLIIERIGWDDYFESQLVIRLLSTFLYLCLTFLFSVMIYKYYELPFLRLRDRIRFRQVKTRI